MKYNRKNRIEREIKLLSKKINALNNKNRLTLLGLLYIENMRSFTELAHETKIDSNKLSYHIKILIDSKLISKKDDKYTLTNKGEDILLDIGFVEEIKDLIEYKPPPKPLERGRAVLREELNIGENLGTLIRTFEEKSIITEPTFKEFVESLAKTNERDKKLSPSYSSVNMTRVAGEIYREKMGISLPIDDGIYLRNRKKNSFTCLG